MKKTVNLIILSILFFQFNVRAEDRSLGSFGVDCVNSNPERTLRVTLREEISEKSQIRRYLPYAKIELIEGRHVYLASTDLSPIGASLFNTALPIVREKFYNISEPDSVNSVMWTRLGDGKTKLEFSLVSDTLAADRIYFDATLPGRFPDKMTATLSADVYVPGLDEVRRINLLKAPIDLECKKMRVKY